MLGEDHSLVHDFPEYKITIKKLINENPNFAQEAQRYHSLDEEIRRLELDNAPIGDDTMHHKKQQRAQLKDAIYQQLLASKRAD